VKRLVVRPTWLKALLVLCVFVASVGAGSAQEVKQAGTDVPPPRRTKFVAPVYPPEAQASGQRGIVILELVVGVQGKIESVTVVRSVPPFDEAATAAVRQWEYEVTRVDGRPVAVRLTVPITFALRLPTVVRAPGIPELRMGAAPRLPPEPWSRSEAVVEADVTLDPDGQVVDALITAGDSPWAEALLQALRTWRFVGNPAEGPLLFKTRARFVTGQGQPRVDLELTDPRREAPTPADAEAGQEPAASSAPSPAVPPEPSVEAPESQAAAPSATPPPTAPPTVPPAPPAAAPTPPPATLPTTTPATTGATAPAPTMPAAKGSGSAAPTAEASPEAPPVEVVPPAPPPPPPPEGGGGSAVRGILLGPGVPDLVSGRRPVVPPLARLNTVAGKVHVRFAVDASGSTSNTEAEGPESLREAARQAVASWIFRRTRADRLHLMAEFDYGVENATAIVNVDPEK
jgi:TonB family protein